MARWMPSIAIVLAACSAPVGAASVGGGNDDDPRDGGAAPADPIAGDGAAPKARRLAVGVVAIDLQQTFFDTAARRNPESDVPARVARSADLLRAARAHDVPVFVTFEATKTGDHALPASIASAMPVGAKDFIKTTFAATGQPQLAAALRDSKRGTFVVLGAETDVCILQSILGMRRAGFGVIAVTDALVTEEVNVAPALRRMKQAGVVAATAAEAANILAARDTDATAPSMPPIVKPFEIAILLDDVAGLGAPDPNAAAKKARLRELLLVTEWFRLPVLAADPAATYDALPADLKSLLTRPIVALANAPASVKQVAIAGGHAQVAARATALAAKGDVFVIEDALVGATHAELEPLYAAGAVPTTYKTLYYELIHSVNDAEWPSPQWVADGTRFYYDATVAPEDLPPLR